MRRRHLLTSTLPLAMATPWSRAAGDTPVRLLASGAFSDTHRELAPLYREHLGLSVEASFGSSINSAPTSVPRRLEQGEPADVVLAAAATLDDLAARGLVRTGSRVDLLRSALGAVVPADAPLPALGTAEELAAALLQAPSIAYSASLSGVYYATALLKKLGIEAQVLPKSRKTAPGERVAVVVARGEASLGIQQVSELLGVPGTRFAGRLPDSVQHYTVLAAGIASTARHPEGARALIDFLANAPVVHAACRRNGLEPLR